MSQVVVVTGAGSGIGRACTLALAEAGWKVVLAGRTLASLEETRAAAGNQAENLLCVPTNVSDTIAVDALFAKATEAFGHVDVVFNNAGNNVPPGTIDQIAVEDWQKVLNVNVHGAFLVARAAFATMRAQDPQGGRIINNGSISAHVPRPGSTPYTMSKHAITGLTRTLSLDGRPFNIACGQIDIGNTASDMTEQMLKGVPQADGSMKPEAVMDVSNVSSTLLHMASLPLSANVQFVTVMASGMPYIGRG